MQYYEALAQEMMSALDQTIKSPPQEEISAAMRGEMAVLRLLRRAEKPLPAGEISRALSMTTSRIAAVLGSLEKKEMILRQADKADKRRVLVTLTDKGDAFCLKRRQRYAAAAYERIARGMQHIAADRADVQLKPHKVAGAVSI